MRRRPDSTMRVENRLDQPLPSTCVLTRHPSDPRKVISGYNNHIHSTGTIVVVDGKNYLTLVNYPGVDRARA